MTRAVAILMVDHAGHPGSAMVERLGAALYGRFLEAGPYEQVHVLAGGGDDPCALLAATIAEQAARVDAVDLVLSVHTTERDPARWRDLLPPSARKLRLVYSTACKGDAAERAAWEAVEARTIVTHVGLNNPLTQTPYFLSRYLAGASVGEAAAAAFDEEARVARFSLSLPGAPTRETLGRKGKDFVAGSRPVVTGDADLTLDVPADTNLPDEQTCLPDEHTCLPDEHTCLPDEHTCLPDEHTCLPDEHTCLPDEHTCLPDEHTCLPDEHTCLPDEHTCLPDEHTCLPDEHTCLPDEHTCLPDELSFARETGGALGLILRALADRFTLEGDEFRDWLYGTSPKAEAYLADRRGVFRSAHVAWTLDEAAQAREPELLAHLERPVSFDLPLGLELRLDDTAALRVTLLDPVARQVEVHLRGVSVRWKLLELPLSRLLLEPEPSRPGYVVRAWSTLLGFSPGGFPLRIGGSLPEPLDGQGPRFRHATPTEA